MARSLYARVAGRGFPVFNASGQTGQGALPDSTAPPARAGKPEGGWRDPNQDPASQPAVQSPPQLYVVGGVSLWGLPGAANPDNTPKDHAAPFADPTADIGSYYAEADATHAATFTGPRVRNDVPSVRQFALEHRVAQGGDRSDQQPLAGPIRANAGFDAVQGYGGGADGPGGVNKTMPVTVENKDYPGVLYDTYVSAGEVPFLSAEVAQFVAKDPHLPSWTGGGFDVPTANVSTQEPTEADMPAQGRPLAATAPAYAGSFWS